MLDIFTISKSSFKQVNDCKVFKHGIISDHSAVIMKIVISYIEHKGESKISTGIIDWEKIMYNAECRQRFNDRLEELSYNSYGVFFENVMRAGRKTAMKLNYYYKGWFEDSKGILQPSIDKKQQLLTEMRAEEGADLRIQMKTKLKAISEEVGNKIAIAEEN